MKPEDFITKQFIEEQMLLLKTAAEQVHALFCIMSHEDDCRFYQSSWDEPDRKEWLNKTIQIMETFNIQGPKDLLVFITKAKEIIADNGAAMISFMSLIISPDLLEDYMTVDNTVATDKVDNNVYLIETVFGAITIVKPSKLMWAETGSIVADWLSRVESTLDKPEHTDDAQPVLPVSLQESLPSAAAESSSPVIKSDNLNSALPSSEPLSYTSHTGENTLDESHQGELPPAHE